MKVVKLQFILKFESICRLHSSAQKTQLFNYLNVILLTTCDSGVPVIQYKATSSLSITKTEQ